MRLGREKAFERIGQQSLIERTIDCLSSVSQSVLVVTSQEQSAFLSSVCPKGKVVADLYPGKATLGGIYTGLMNAETSYSVVVGCDMPFLNHDLLRYLIDMSSGFDAVVPRLGTMIEPLHAVYSRRCVSSIEDLLCQGVCAVRRLFELVETRYVDDSEIDRFDPEHLSFFNVNTEDDLRKARSLIKQMEQF